MYLTKNEKMFIAYLIYGWGDEAGFGDSYLWNDLTPEQLNKIQWLFDGRETLQKKLETAGITNDAVVDRMDLPEELKRNFR
ncbi:hypothetical protein [Enterococcus sp. AZ007]|uniref:hypothetical protein n=1 Tax=Enterococcus sp. AZ007 TaxID=2774839 RepID=UPI003F269478